MTVRGESRRKGEPMFVGREHELAALERMYASDRFEMMVVYGRRRVGKTALIDRFLQGKRALYFTARQQSSRLILRAFACAVSDFYGYSTPLAFETWEAAIDFLVKNAKETTASDGGKTIIVLDEFPYAAESEPGLPSLLQIAIDHGFAGTNTMLILSGSNQGFMENKVLGYQSPLYGRRTGQLNLRPFDYRDAARFVEGCTPEDAIRYYATFGGTPYYLAQLRPGLSYEENVAALCFDQSGLLYGEPMMMLREELKSPALYDSILQAISDGCNTGKAICDRTGIEQTSLSFYLRTLEGLRLVERVVPFGEKPTSRKGRIRIIDPFFAYWYRFVAPNVTFIETGNGHAICESTCRSEVFSTYVGQQFEGMCMQWVMRAFAAGLLPLAPAKIGKWWGNNPLKREQTDIDVVAADDAAGKLLLGECKWRNAVNETKMIEALKERVGLIRGYDETLLAFFTKNPVSSATKTRYAGDEGMMFVCAQDMLAV